MKRSLSRLALVAAALLGAPLYSSAQSNSRPPGQISYQGFLSDANGTPLATNTPQNYNIVFKLYNDPSASASTNILWGEQQVITVDRGFFTALLGVGSTVSGVPHTNDLSGYFNAGDASSRYVGMTVLGLTAGDPEITPRLQMLANPYSLLAATAVSAVNAGNATNATLAATATFAVSAANAAYATNAGFATNASMATTATYAAFATNLLGGGGLWNTNTGNGQLYTLAHVGINTNSADSQLTIFGGQTIYGFNPSLLIRLGTSFSSSGLNLGVASQTGSFISQANPGDSVLNSISGKLHLAAVGSPGAFMTISTNGAIGIGTANPIFPLVVNGTIYNGGVNNYEYINANSVGHSSFNASSFSIWCSSSIYVGGEVDVTSDARIKNIQGVSNGGQDLRTLLGLEVTDYTYKDFVAKGNRPNKKVIAQQVEKIYPQAVRSDKGVIPDIYQSAGVTNNWIDLDCPVKAGERVQVIVRGKSPETLEVAEVGQGKFRLAGSIPDGRVFVFGREVDDLRTVDYDAIAMLNVSATQELARKLDAKDQQIAELTARLKLLEARDQARDARLARLESRLNEGAARTVRASLERE